MDGKIKIKGQLKFYMQWPAVLSILLILMDVLVFTVSVKAPKNYFIPIPYSETVKAHLPQTPGWEL